MTFVVPVIPDTAPFTVEQRAWLNGYLAGLFSRGPVDPAVGSAPASTTPALKPLTILYGSQTGSAEGLAKRAAKDAAKRGYAPTVLGMEQVDLARLAGEPNLLVITSTYGDGEPPDNARALHAALKSAAQTDSPAPTLASVRFSVCALGDTNYVQFCQCGRELDTWLERLGAMRATVRAECDLDHETKYQTWLDAALTALNGPSAVSPPLPATTPVATAPATETGYSRAQPFLAPVLSIRGLNGADSAKEVNHVELSLEGSGLSYEAGDALGVVPHNCPELVADILQALGCDGEEAVACPGGELPLRRALTECYDLGKPTPELLAWYEAQLASAVSSARPVAPLPSSPPFHVIDLLHRATSAPSVAPTEFISRLKRIQPRLYSISSSPKACPGRVHLTVGAVRYEHEGRARKGVCSTFLAERALGTGRVGVFVHSNRTFRLPKRGETPIIMIGPGTGIAPFRAFLEERRATGATGENWLFFGDQKSACDFLYREELHALQAASVLTRLDLAFSRDQTAKIYVQHRMEERAEDLYAWLERGAHVYVCGDAARMAKDVDRTLHQIIERAGKKSPATAADYVQTLRSQGRYQRDVY